MNENHAPQHQLTRRSFIAKAAATGLAAGCGLDLVRGVSTAGAAAARSDQKCIFTLNDMPPTTDKVNLGVYNSQVAGFHKLHPNITVVGRNDTFDVNTFYAHYAVGLAEDTYKVYFTDVQHIIQLGYAKDITDQVKAWKWFSSTSPSVLQIMSNDAGRVFGLAVDCYALGLAYSVPAFKAAGLDPNQPPTTWDQFRTYAKKLTNSSKKQLGFAPLAISHTGGWHLTAMIYSFGGQPEIVKNGRTMANFNSPEGLKALQLLYDMRWVDGSIGGKELGYNDNTQELANGQIAMAILAGDQPRFFKTQYQTPIENFYLAGLPQGGGNATLMGGDVQMVNPKASDAQTVGALLFTEYRYYDLDGYEANDKALLAGGGTVGIPSNIAYTGTLKAAQDAIDAKYRNVPPQNYALFTAANAKIKLTPEPRVLAQDMYAALDTCVQAVLSSKSAKPQQLLDDAAKQFQKKLDSAK